MERAAPYVRRPQPLAEGAEQRQWAGDDTGRHQVRDQGGGLRAAATEVAEHAFHGPVEFGGPSVEDAALDLRKRAEIPQFVAHAHPADRCIGAAEHACHVLRRVLGDELKHREVFVATRWQVAGHGGGDVEVYLDQLRIPQRAGYPRRRLVPDRGRCWPSGAAGPRRGECRQRTCGGRGRTSHRRKRRWW